MHGHRRIYLVDRSFQLKYILLLAGCGLALAAVTGAWTYLAEQQVAEALLQDPEQRALFEAASRQILWPLGVIGLLAAATLGAVGYVVTYRIAGPVYVMSRVLEMLGQGLYPARRSLRRHDELKAFYARFLDGVEALRSREVRLLQELEDVADVVDRAAPRAPELAELAQRLRADLARRRAALGPATTPPPVPTAAPGRV